MSDPFIDLSLGVQALRRKVEREVAGLGGATGVAAVPYPHQLANAQRVLTDTRIRHLIADEVGLGKTVQALMILNALRLQNPDHRTLILAPENLAPQWLMECRARGHIVPLDHAPPEGARAHVRLAYYEQLQSVTEIDPNLYDLLIVDEIQRLQSAARQRIEDVAADFRQLLLLSATPKLDDVQGVRQLFSILEPERMAIAGGISADPEDVLREQEHRAAELLHNAGPAEWAHAGLPIPPESARSATIASTYCTLRRITNTRRRDYPDLLPKRVLNPVPVEPTADEIARQEQVWRYIGFARAADDSTNLARLGQVAIRSSRALSERINVLRGRDQRDPHGYLQRATAHLDPANGDSRLEALVDVLADIWLKDPTEAVLVVAEDNPTVDYLKTQVPQYLPEIGPRGARRPLSLAVKRNRDAAATADLVDLFEEYDDTLGGFVEGDDQLLIAADIAQVGLNLQHARKLIFFSIPWSPAAVEQWIGRLDRLGSAALLERRGERTIDIYAIYGRGQVDERVVTVLDDFSVFRRSIRLDSEEIKLVSQEIMDAALAPHAASWARLSAEARGFSRDDDDPLVTPLSPLLPWNPDQARELAEYFDRNGSIGPLLENTRSERAIVRIEAGLRGWMRLMGRANELRLWKKSSPDNPDRRFRLLHYYRPAYAQGPIQPRFALPGLDPSEGQRYAYLDSRRDLESPPLQTVDIDDNRETPLEFLDHGDPLHEALLTEWTQIGKSAPSNLIVRYPGNHPLAAPEAKGHYVVAILSWTPGDLHLRDLDRSVAMQCLQDARTRPEQKPLLDGIQRMEEELYADRRWLSSLFTPRLDILAARLQDGRATLVDDDTAAALLTPWNIAARGKEVQLASGQRAATAPSLKAERQAAASALLEEYRARHQRSLAECSNLRAKISARCYQVAAEAEDLIRWRQAMLDDAAAQGMETSEQGFARSRFRTLRNARDMAMLARDIRLSRLDGLIDELQTPRYAEYKLTTLLVE